MPKVHKGNRNIDGTDEGAAVERLVELEAGVAVGAAARVRTAPVTALRRASVTTLMSLIAPYFVPKLLTILAQGVNIALQTSKQAPWCPKNFSGRRCLNFGGLKRFATFSENFDTLKSWDLGPKLGRSEKWLPHYRGRDDFWGPNFYHLKL